MASSYVRRNITPGEPTRITLPSTRAMVLLELDGKTRTVTLDPNGSVRIQGEGPDRVTLASLCGIHRSNLDGTWYAYLSEDEI